MFNKGGLFFDGDGGKLQRWECTPNPFDDLGDAPPARHRLRAIAVNG